MNNSFVFRDQSVINDITEWAMKERNKKTNWFLFDKVLYDLCLKYPKHNNIHEIVTKVALIGRAYSASVERRRNADVTKERDFYYGYVAPVILNSELDMRIYELRGYKTPTEDNLCKILSVHFYLQKLLKECTDMEKRSFSSKYLHFHCPNLFYIFDSYSEKEINKIVKSKYKWVCPSDSDYSYAKYCEKSFFVQQRIAPDEMNFPRIIDSFLQANYRA